MGESVSLTATPSGIDATAPRGYQLEKWLWFPLTETPLTAQTIHLKYIWIPTLRQPQYFHRFLRQVFIQVRFNSIWSRNSL